MDASGQIDAGIVAVRGRGALRPHELDERFDVVGIPVRRS
jgi:hypothetical protein